MAGGLCEERHGCLGAADVEVESSGAFPTHLLIGVEEFFDVPSLGEIQGEGFDLVSEASRQEGFEVEFLGCFSCALDELAIDVVRGVAEGEISVSGGPSGPAGHKAAGRDLEQGFLEGLGVGHGSQKVEGGETDRVLFWRPKAAMTRSTDRLLIGRPHCRIFWAITSVEASGSRKRWRMT